MELNYYKSATVTDTMFLSYSVEVNYYKSATVANTMFLSYSVELISKQQLLTQCS